MKKIIKALVFALSVAILVCVFAIVASAERATVYTVTSDGYNGAAGTFEGELISAMNSGAPAIVRLETDARFAGMLSITAGADVTIDLNGHTLTMWSSGNANKGFLFESHGTQFAICDMSAAGGGTIETNEPVVMMKQPWVNQACDDVGNFTHVVFDNVTVNYTGAGAGYMNCPIEVEDLCVELDIKSCVFNSPEAGFIHIETNMSQLRHAFDFDVRNTVINVAAYVVRFDQYTSTHMVNYYLIEGKRWNFENCTITTDGLDSTYPFMYPNWGTASTYWNYLPSHHIFVRDPTSFDGWGVGEVVPNADNVPVLNLNNCTVSTKADGLASSPAFNPSVININGGTYKINTDGEADGEKFITRGEEVQMFQKVTLGTYDDGDSLCYPSFNFDPSAVQSTVFGGLYNANCMKEGKTYTIKRDPLRYVVAEKTVGVDTMWVLEDRVFVEGLLYNLSLSNKMSINLAIPKGTWDGITVSVNGELLEGADVDVGGTAYYAVVFDGLDIVSATKEYEFVITEQVNNDGVMIDGAAKRVKLSVLGYANAILAGNHTAVEKELARAIIAYALAAEEYLETDDDAYLTLIDAYDAALEVDGVVAPALLDSFDGAVDTSALGATALSGVAINFGANAPAFVLSLDDGVDSLAVKVKYLSEKGGFVVKNYTLTAENKQIRLNAMKAYDFDNDITVTVGGNSYVFNLATVLNKLIEDDGAIYKNFANALYYYVKAAEAYQNQQ